MCTITDPQRALRENEESLIWGGKDVCLCNKTAFEAAPTPVVSYSLVIHWLQSEAIERSQKAAKTMKFSMIKKEIELSPYSGIF